MQKAEKVLDIISDRGKRKLPLFRIYRLLYNKELFLRLQKYLCQQRRDDKGRNKRNG